jgi:hypothetical protein
MVTGPCEAGKAPTPSMQEAEEGGICLLGCDEEPME